MHAVDQKERHGHCVMTIFSRRQSPQADSDTYTQRWQILQGRHYFASHVTSLVTWRACSNLWCWGERLQWSSGAVCPLGVDHLRRLASYLPIKLCCWRSGDVALCWPVAPSSLLRQVGREAVRVASLCRKPLMRMREWPWPFRAHGVLTKLIHHLPYGEYSALPLQWKIKWLSLFPISDPLPHTPPLSLPVP